MGLLKDVGRLEAELRSAKEKILTTLIESSLKRKEAYSDTLTYTPEITSTRVSFKRIR